MKHTRDELRQWQALPLSIKIRMTQQRIRDWVHEYGEGGCYISFSGGKDSTVLLDIARKMGYDIPAVFVNVPTQYPELRDFAKTFNNVVILNPKISFLEVCEKYGFPLISKEVAQCVDEARKYVANNNVYKYRYERIIGEGRYSKGGDRHSFSKERYKFFLDAPFEISNKCCNVMKKDPLKKYEKETGRFPITAEMADESFLRTQKWLQNGCNGFDLKRPKSTPMAFWTEQDVLRYIKKYNIPICSVYGDIVEDEELTSEAGREIGEKFLKTTGCSRTGCMLCGFGCHLEKSPNRFEMLKETHPGMYDMLDRVKNNGITFREAIEWTNKHGNTDIKL